MPDEVPTGRARQLAPRFLKYPWARPEPLEPCERPIKLWIERAQVGRHNSITFNFGKAHALSQLCPEKRAYWLERTRNIEVADHRRGDKAMALFVQHIELIHATPDNPHHGLKDKRTGIALLKRKTYRSRHDRVSPFGKGKGTRTTNTRTTERKRETDGRTCDIFEPERLLLPIIFSCHGRLLCAQEVLDYERWIGTDEDCLKYYEKLIAQITNGTQRQDALQTASRDHPAFVESLKRVAAAYPEPIFCPYDFGGSAAFWPFFE